MKTIIIEFPVEIGGYEFPVELEVDYQPEEPMERYYPGCPEGVEYSASMFGQELPFEHPIVQGIDPDTVLELYKEKQW